MLKLKTWEFDPEKGHDVMVSTGPLDFDPKKYKTAAGAAKGLYEALCKMAEKMGMNPKSEVALWKPGEGYTSDYKCWTVVWEAGPFEWAIPLSMEIRGPWGHCEPYYSFDLCFVEEK